MAARRAPHRRREASMLVAGVRANSESRVHLDEVIMSHPAASRIPISPSRLYIIACKAAVFASDRVNHQPISRKERNPTPSQPINS